MDSEVHGVERKPSDSWDWRDLDAVADDVSPYVMSWTTYAAARRTDCRLVDRFEPTWEASRTCREKRFL